MESESPAQQFVVVQIANGFSDHGDRFVVLPAEGRPLYRLAERLRKLIQRSRQRQPAVSDADHLWGAKLKEGRSGGQLIDVMEASQDWLCDHFGALMAELSGDPCARISLPDRSMGTPLVEVGDVFSQHPRSFGSLRSHFYWPRLEGREFSGDRFCF